MMPALVGFGARCATVDGTPVTHTIQESGKDPVDGGMRSRGKWVSREKPEERESKEK
jgi:hypothetical protein